MRGELDGLRQSSALALANLRRAASLVQSFKRTSIDQTSEQIRQTRHEGTHQRCPVCAAGQSQASSRHHQRSCPDALVLEGAPGLIEQLITNLVMNAVQHAFEDGQRAGTIRIRVRRETDDVHLEFSDDGVGMEADQMARIFEPFYTTRRGQGGSGLGLYICYSIVTTRLKGTIQCYGQVPAGCRFDVHFPANLVETAEQAKP